MTKIVLLLALFSSSGFLGFQISKVYDSKVKFFQDCFDFVKNIKTEISFLNTDLISIFSKYKYQSIFEEIKNQIAKLYENQNIFNIENIKNIISNNITLKDDELNTISQMFFELGNVGYFEQLERLEYYENYFKNTLTKQKDRADKMMPFCKKMGILIGLLVCIVLI